MNDERRGYDEQIEEIKKDLKELKDKLDPVLDGIIALKVIGKVSKWLAVVAAGAGAWMFFSRGGPH
jgi:hypothetical protein